jgi:hypothetical protein
MNDIQELDLGLMDQVSGGIMNPVCIIGFLRGWGAGKLMDAAWDAIRDHNESGAAAEFQMGDGAGAGTFG